MTNPNGHRYHLTLSDPELSTIHFAILQTRAKARRRLRRGCRRCQRLFDAAQAIHQRLLPLRAKPTHPPTTALPQHPLYVNHLQARLLKLSLVVEREHLDQPDWDGQPPPPWVIEMADRLLLRLTAIIDHSDN